VWKLNTDQLVECPGATGGAILNRSLGSYPGIAAFQPVINGVAGNLGAVPAFPKKDKKHDENMHPNKE
jgi:hypothetical protein